MNHLPTMRISPSRFVWTAALALLAAVGSARAYPEFQQYISKSSGRPVNCALCHTHSDGPEGTAPGQIGKLTPAELTELGLARAAFNPGSKAHNPILNAFGNHIIEAIGKTKVIELKREPEKLAAALPQDSDMDHDGIPDAVEVATGTHPLLKSDGRPWLLFKANFGTNWGQIILMLGATVFGLWGLKHILNGFAKATDADSEAHEES